VSAALFEKFGARVRQLRKAARLSQEELAERCHMHRNYVGGIERGERNPSLQNIALLALALGVEPSELFVSITRADIEIVRDQRHAR
jgi:transcriptional regulator with XRE-family HTH domain